MLHLVFCPHCGGNVKIHCDNVPNPFQKIHADHIVRLLNPKAELPAIDPPSASTQSTLKLMFLLDMLGDDLPPLEELPKLPPIIEDYIDHADANKIKHILIQTVGRWDALASYATSE